jgi:hypothetical protein
MQMTALAGRYFANAKTTEVEILVIPMSASMIRQRSGCSEDVSRMAR